MKTWFFLCGILLGFLSVSGSPAPAATFAASKAVNSLGIDLLHKSTSPGANALISPYSIQSALAMAYAGADGVTREEMARTLHYPKDETALHQSFDALRRELDEVVRSSEEVAQQERRYGGTTDPVVLTVANRLFGQSGYDFRPAFQSLVKDLYAAPFEPLDFIKNSAGATRHINEWVEAQTRKRICNAVPEGALTKLARLVLVNTIYLKAPWPDPFPSDATQPGPFYVNGAKRVEVPMMQQQEKMGYAEADDFAAVQLPFKADALRFLILLPKKVDGLAAMESRLSAENFTGTLKWWKRDVSLSLPKFRIEPPAMALGKTLQTLGMKTAFDVPVGSARFDRIAPRRPDDYLALSEVLHKTYLDLDEKGVEAAASTLPGFEIAGVLDRAKQITFTVDHPFLFAILHEPSGTFLFLGHVADPR